MHTTITNAATPSREMAKNRIITQPPDCKTFDAEDFRRRFAKSEDEDEEEE